MDGQRPEERAVTSDVQRQHRVVTRQDKPQTAQRGMTYCVAIRVTLGGVGDLPINGAEPRIPRREGCGYPPGGARDGEGKDRQPEQDVQVDAIQEPSKTA